MPENLLLTVREVANLTDKSMSTVIRWADGGMLPVAQRLPGKTGAYLFTRQAVEALFASGVVTTRVVVTEPVSQPEPSEAA